MKSFLRGRSWLLALAAGGILWLPSVSRAFPPAPNHVIYGLVRDEYGQPLTQPNAQIIFTVEGTNGLSITGGITPDIEPGINYRLELPMDSGTAPDLYKATALMPEVPFRIRVKVGSVTYLPIEMTGNYANLGQPAQSTRIDLTLGVDANNDGIPDAWQQLLNAMLPGADTSPGADPDHDGMSNLQEYLAGTYAWSPDTGFELSLISNPGGRPLLEFTVVNTHTYTVFSSSNLVDWASIPFDIPANGSTATNLPNYTATDTRILQVQPIFGNGSSVTRQFFKVKMQ